ncbi:unnamed protein product [Auanema sp. JU1783]|nr:unnamed protein product [Auanema sp. JU1783]
MMAQTQEDVSVERKKTEQEQKAKPANPKGFIRYVMLTVSIICLSSIMANIVCFNFTVLCMPGIKVPLTDILNMTLVDEKSEGFTKYERTLLFSSVAIGALVSVIPFSHFITTVGCRKMFTLAGIITAIATGFIPQVADNNLNMFLALRFLQGISFSACMPAVGSITASWASLSQNGLFMAVLTTFAQVSAIFSMPISGELCESEYGWQSIYYLHSVFCVFCFIIFACIYRNTPEEHPWISVEEIEFIAAGKKVRIPEKGEEPTGIPYLSIMTTPSVWGVWVGALGDLIAIQLIHTFSPLYMRQVLQYSVHKTGFAAALPVLMQFFVKVFAGHTSDRITQVSETTKLRIYNTIALGASALFMIALAFVTKGQSTAGIVLISLTTAMFGFNGGGFNKCATLVSRQYSPFVLGNVQFIWCIAMLFCPILVSLLLQTGDVSEWRLVYLVHAAILLLSNLFFCLVATAKPAPWTDNSIRPSSKKNTPLYVA